MTYQYRYAVLSPTALDRLCRERRAVLGPGPRGVTVTTKDELGRELVVKYQILSIFDVEGQKSIKLVRREWKED